MSKRRNSSKATKIIHAAKAGVSVLEALERLAIRAFLFAVLVYELARALR